MDGAVCNGLGRNWGQENRSDNLLATVMKPNENQAKYLHKLNLSVLFTLFALDLIPTYYLKKTISSTAYVKAACTLP